MENEGNLFPDKCESDEILNGFCNMEIDRRGRDRDLDRERGLIRD